MATFEICGLGPGRFRDVIIHQHKKPSEQPWAYSGHKALRAASFNIVLSRKLNKIAQKVEMKETCRLYRITVILDGLN